VTFSPEASPLRLRTSEYSLPNLLIKSHSFILLVQLLGHPLVFTTKFMVRFVVRDPDQKGGPLGKFCWEAQNADVCQGPWLILPRGRQRSRKGQFWRNKERKIDFLKINHVSNTQLHSHSQIWEYFRWG
jgi:hypothetical protein